MWVVFRLIKLNYCPNFILIDHMTVSLFNTHGDTVYTTHTHVTVVIYHHPPTCTYIYILCMLKYSLLIINTNRHLTRVADALTHETHARRQNMLTQSITTFAHTYRVFSSVSTQCKTI